MDLMTIPTPEATDRPARRVLQGAVLAMAGLVASMGVTFGCLVRNIVVWPDAFARGLPDFGSAGDVPAKIGQLPGTGLGDVALTLITLVAMMVWVLALVMFVRERPRAPLTYVLTAVIAGLFLWSSWGVWRLAYPVCNVF